MSEVLIFLPEASAAANPPVLAAERRLFSTPVLLHPLPRLHRNQLTCCHCHLKCDSNPRELGEIFSRPQKWGHCEKTCMQYRAIRSVVLAQAFPGVLAHPDKCIAGNSCYYKVTRKMQAVILPWMYQCGPQIRAVTEEPCLLLVLCTPGHRALLLGTRGQKYLLINATRWEPRGWWLVMKQPLHFYFSAIYQENWEASIFCALILFLRWQFGHKSAISMAYSLQSSCLFPTPLFQANIQ